MGSSPGIWFRRPDPILLALVVYFHAWGTVGSLRLARGGGARGQESPVTAKWSRILHAHEPALFVLLHAGKVDSYRIKTGILTRTKVAGFS